MGITQVETARNMVQIHVKGYDEKFDEWGDGNNLPVFVSLRLQPMSQPSKTIRCLYSIVLIFCNKDI